MASASTRLEAGAFAGFAGIARTAASRSARAVRSYLKRALRRHATGRIAFVLSSMSDEQLAAIGVERSQIPRYASEIVSGE